MEQPSMLRTGITSATGAAIAVAVGMGLVMWIFHPAYWGKFALHIVAVFGILIWALLWSATYNLERVRGEMRRDAAEARESRARLRQKLDV
jgi:hypothetical protein